MYVRYGFGVFWFLMAVIFLTGNSSLMFEGAMVYAATPLLVYVLGAVAVSTPWILAALPFQAGLTFKRTWFGLMRPTGGTVVVFAAYGIFIVYNVLNGSNALTTSRVNIVAEKQSDFDNKKRLEGKRAELVREQDALPKYRPAFAVASLIAAEKGAELQARIDVIDGELAKMGAVSEETDPQATALAKWSGRTPEEIRAATGAFGPVALEFGALTFLVFAGWCFGWKHSLLREIPDAAPGVAAGGQIDPPKLLPQRDAMDRAPSLSNEALSRSRELCEWFFRHKSRPVSGGALAEREWFDHYEAVCKASKDVPLPLPVFRRIASKFVPTITTLDGETVYKGVLPLMGEELPA
jgi:hypothetical protein